MGKNKMIAKSCPKCEMQVAVASKSCKCGHIFFSARRAAEQLVGATIAGGVGGDDIRRRTSRVRRAQPQFYDSQHYQKQTRRVRSPKKRSLSESVDESYKSKDKERGSSRARRRRALRRGKHSAPTSSPNANTAGGDLGKLGAPAPATATATATATSAGDLVRPPLRPTQLARAALILHEINRKMRAVVWQPSD